MQQLHPSPPRHFPQAMNDVGSSCGYRSAASQNREESHSGENMVVELNPYPEGSRERQHISHNYGGDGRIEGLAPAIATANDGR